MVFSGFTGFSGQTGPVSPLGEATFGRYCGKPGKYLIIQLKPGILRFRPDWVGI